MINDDRLLHYSRYGITSIYLKISVNKVTKWCNADLTSHVSDTAALTRRYLAPGSGHNTCTEGRAESLDQLEMVRVTELVDQSLASLCLLHDPLLVVLPQGTGQLVVVHGGTILTRIPLILFCTSLPVLSSLPFSSPRGWRPSRSQQS